MGQVVEKEPEAPSGTEALNRSEMMPRLIILLLLLLPFSITAAESGQASFCLDVLPIFRSEGFFFAGGEAAINYLGGAEEYEQYIAFYSWDGGFKSLGAFEGTFSGAFSSEHMVYILEDGKGFSRYKLEKGAVLFKGFQEAGDGGVWLAGTVEQGIVYVLAFRGGAQRLEVLAVDPEKGERTVYAATEMVLEPLDARLVFSDGRPVISWRAKGIKGLGFLFQTGDGWERGDFVRAEVNSYDLAPGPVLYFIGNLDFDHKSRIGVSVWRDMAWTAPEPISGSEMPYAEKYNRIRVQSGPGDEKLLTRTGYLPFGIEGVQMFKYADGLWRLIIPGLHLMAGMVAFSGLFVAGIILVAALIRKWFPALLYHRVQTVLVGSLLSRLAGYMVDFAVSAIIAVAVTGMLRFQDMNVMVYSYVLYTTFFICLFLYGMVMEVLTGTTLGKLIMGLQLYNRIGMRCSLQEVLLRNMVKVFEAHMLIVPALAILFTEKNQRLGDIIAGTRVQKKESYGL